MSVLVRALKWLAKFLEARFPEKLNPAMLATKEEVGIIRLGAESAIASVCRLSVEIEKLQKQVELLNLRVGLTRPMQTVLGRKQNG